MSAGDDTVTPTRGPGSPGWRDVYDAVKQSEERIITHLDDIVRPLNVGQSDHEARLRMIEQGQTPWQLDLTRRHESHGARIGVTENRIDSFADREKGILGTLNAGQRILLVAVSISGAILTVLNIIAIATRQP